MVRSARAVCFLCLFPSSLPKSRKRFIRRIYGGFGTFPAASQGQPLACCHPHDHRHDHRHDRRRLHLHVHGLTDRRRHSEVVHVQNCCFAAVGLG